MRIGHGFDVHKFGENGSGPLIIGGVRIPYEKGYWPILTAMLHYMRPLMRY